MNTFFKTAALVALLTVAAHSLRADPPSTTDLTKDILKLAGVNGDSLQFDPVAKADFAIPQSSAAAVLNSSAEVLRPSTPRETSTALLSHFENGALKTGFSVAITPYTLLRPRPLQWKEYHDSPYYQFMSRLQVSLAATNGGNTTTGTGSANSSAQFGLGLNGIIFDNGDPRTSKEFVAFKAALDKVANKLLTDLVNQGTAIARGESPKEPTVDPRLKQDAVAKLKEAQAASWNAAAMGFGYAVRFKSATGKINDAKESGGGAWLNYSHPGFGAWESASQLLFSSSYRYHDDFTSNGVTGKQDTFNTGAQVRLGASDHNYYAQWFYKWKRPKGTAATHASPVEIGAEFKLSNGLWINLGWSNDKDLGGNSAFKTGIRYGFGDKAVLSPLPP